MCGPAQRLFEELRGQGLPADVDPTLGVALGDVDGDGDLDVVFANYYAQSRLSLNDSTGIFIDATPNLPTFSDRVYGVALGDVDGDNDLDIMLAVAGQDRLWLNDGSGRFAEATGTRMPRAFYSSEVVALGDVDADGDLDAVFGDTVGARLLVNDGTGTYIDATAQRMPGGQHDIVAVALGDIDGDGDLDVVLGKNLSHSLVYRNDGSGTFVDTTGTSMPRSAQQIVSVALGDVDGDNDLDAVFGNAIDPFGVLPAQDQLYLNDGSGVFRDATARLPRDNDSSWSIAFGDVDGDNDLDILFAIGSVYLVPGQNRLYINDGAGTYRDATAPNVPAGGDVSLAAALGDVDGDGDLDAIFGNLYQQNRLCFNGGSGAFTEATGARIPASQDDTTTILLGDIDGDRDLDLVVGNGPAPQPNRVYVNSGDGAFTDQSLRSLPSGDDRTTTAALGDIDGDGDLDLLLGNYASQNRLLVNDGTGKFADLTGIRMPSDSDLTSAVALGDIDRDGDLDLVIGNSGQNRLYINDGAGTFQDATAARFPADGDSTNAVVLGDVDGDGDLDAIIGNSPLPLGGQNRLYINDGAGGYFDATSMRMPSVSDPTTSLALGDVDSDGDLDLVIANGLTRYFSTEPDRLYLNDGAGVYSEATALRLPVSADATSGVALADVDAYGDLDIVFGNAKIAYLSPPMPNRLLLNDGAGTFVDATSAYMPGDDESVCLAIGDVDGDADLDVVFGAYGADRLYTNLTRQLDVPLVPRLGHLYRLDVYARRGPPGTVDLALPFVSTAAASIPLPPLGTVGLAPARTLVLPPFLIAPLSGVGSIAFTVPTLPALAGKTIHAQAVVVPYPLQARLTNTTTDVIIR